MPRFPDVYSSVFCPLATTLRYRNTGHYQILFSVHHENCSVFISLFLPQLFCSYLLLMTHY